MSTLCLYSLSVSFSLCPGRDPWSKVLPKPSKYPSTPNSKKEWDTGILPATLLSGTLVRNGR